MKGFIQACIVTLAILINLTTQRYVLIDVMAKKETTGILNVIMSIFFWWTSKALNNFNLNDYHSVWFFIFIVDDSNSLVGRLSNRSAFGGSKRQLFPGAPSSWLGDFENCRESSDKLECLRRNQEKLITYRERDFNYDAGLWYYDWDVPSTFD